VDACCAHQLIHSTHHTPPHHHHHHRHHQQVVFTIHNMNYGQKKIGEAAYYAQKFTTVSPSYAFEVGGHPAIAPHSHKFMGILNGIDPELWDPAGALVMHAIHAGVPLWMTGGGVNGWLGG